MLRPPYPRYRLYTTPDHYLHFFKGLLKPSASPFNESSRLEAAIRNLCGTEHAIPVPQARVGLYLLVRAMVRPGWKVVLSPYTLSDVINMVICAGAIPVFADIDRKTCNVDPAEIERLIDSETDAVLVTHLHGLICDMDPIRESCSRHGVRLIEDAAQSFGSVRGGTHAGAFGDAGVLSFGMYKNVTSFYGGMVLTSDDEVAARVRRDLEGFPLQQADGLIRRAATGLATDLATHPAVFKTFTYWVFRHAYLKDWDLFNRKVTIENDVRRKDHVPSRYLVRMRPLQARMLLDSLPSVAQATRERIARALIYQAGLADISDLLLPPPVYDGSHTYLYYPLQSPHRAELIKHMVREGRDVAVQHLRNCAELDAFSEFARSCPNASATAGQNMLLSTYPRFPLEEVERNVLSIRSFYGRS